MIVAALTLEARAQQRPVIMGGSPTPEGPAGGTGAITGIVVDESTGRPLSGALVTLEERKTGMPIRMSSQVTTPKGRFAFVDLAASDAYTLSAVKAGYLDGGYGRPSSRGPSMPIPLKNGQWIADLRIPLTHPGSISGVVLDERGEPVVGAAVRVLPQIFIAGRAQWLTGNVARTDDRGAYRIAGLGPGAYVVSVPSVQATLPLGATVRPAGAHAGTSTEDFEAASEAEHAEKLLVDAGGGQQIVAGRYAVPPPPDADGRRMTYAIAFYPNAATPADASPIELRAAEDRLGIDLQLHPVRTARVSGTVQGPPDAIGNLLLRLMPAGLEEFGQGSEAATTVTSADGRFTFVDVPSGDYLLEARHTLLEFTYTSVGQARTALPVPVAFPAFWASSGSVAAAPPGVQFSWLRDSAAVPYWGAARVQVADSDLDDVVLPLHRPATMTGQVEWVPGATPSVSAEAGLLEPADGRRSLGRPMTFGGKKPGPGMFALEGLLPGQYFLRFALGSATVVSVTWQGQDYIDRPFDASDGRDITGVVVTLANARSSISGAVTEDAAALSSGAAVIAFPVEADRWSNFGFNPARLKSVLAATGGQYRIEGLPAGEYYLLAVPASQERAWVDPAFLASHAGRATRVRLDRYDATLSNVALSVTR